MRQQREPNVLGWRGWLFCLVGAHDWDDYGQCLRNWKHVIHTPDDYLLGGAYTRVARRKRMARRDAGLDLQLQMAVLGFRVSLALCEDVASRPGEADAMLMLAAERAERGDFDAFDV